MSNLSFRARALEATKPMPIYMAEELPDLPDYSVINRAVPQMPSGMEKEEECEHHLQRAICAGLIIPTPEVCEVGDQEIYDKLYPANYKHPRQLIHMQPFTMEQDIPDYDMDSEDERWLDQQAEKLDITPLKFEEMMDRLEKSSGQTVVSLQEAKALLKEDDDLIIAVFDYWLNKRLKLQHPLILAVKTEHRAGTAVNNPYIAFRRRTEKMLTRKHRKNDQTSYEKMLKLRRDLSRAVSLLDFIKRREKVKRELVHLTVEVFEKRYQAKDFSGAIAAEVLAQKATRPAFTPIFHNNYTNHVWNNKNVQRKDKRQYKKRKHKSLSGHHHHHRMGGVGTLVDPMGGISSDDEQAPLASPDTADEHAEDEGMFAFRRNKNCNYHMPLSAEGNWPWCSHEENGVGDKRYRYTLTSLANPRRCIGFARRRVGRGGRVILDRLDRDANDFWRSMDYTVYEDNKTVCGVVVDNNAKRTTSDLTKTKIVEKETATAAAAAAAALALQEDDAAAADAVRTNKSVNSAASSVVDVKRVRGLSNDVDVDVSNSGGGGLDGANERIQTENKFGGRLQENVDYDDMLEMLRYVQRDWLHFRPKTPPLNNHSQQQQQSYLQSSYSADDDNMLVASIGANTPFTLELQSLDADSDILTESTYLSAPFVLDYDISPLETVPVTDTRQQQQQQQQQTQPTSNINLQQQNAATSSTLKNTLSKRPSSFEEDEAVVFAQQDEDIDGNAVVGDVEDDSVIGCSRFFVSDGSKSAEECNSGGLKSSHCSSSSTLTSPKLNNVNATLLPAIRPKVVGAAQSQNVVAATNANANANATTNTATLMMMTTTTSTSSLSSSAFDSHVNANGIVPQFTIEGANLTRNNKYHQPSYHPYIRAMGNSSGGGGGGGGVGVNSNLSLHTSAHTVTLNSHSANILEIPIPNDSDAAVVTAKSQREHHPAGSTSPNNSKAKTIVRKNNLVMEVT